MVKKLTKTLLKRLIKRLINSDKTKSAKNIANVVKV